MTVNDVPALDGAALLGLATQLGGAPTPQLRPTRLLYPFAAASVPLKTAGEFTLAVRDGSEIFRV